MTLSGEDPREERNLSQISQVNEFSDVNSGGKSFMVNMPVASNTMNLSFNSINPLLVNQDEAAKKCIQSLDFEGMERRKQAIEDECEGTCQWLLSHEKYCTWMEQRPGLLWIKGSPGTGKSTLVKYALKRERSNPNPKVISFFFHGGGNTLQKSPLGLWRSLLQQTLNEIPSLLPEFQVVFEKNFRTQGPHGTTRVWHKEELQEFFRTHVAEQYPVTIFIDALDECGEIVATELVRYFQRLVSRSESTVNICFSCRHCPPLGDGHKLTTILVEEENGEDILKYIQNDLQLTFRHRQDKLNTLLNEISSKASGSFQWANIAVSRATQSYKKGSSMSQILDELQEAPTELSQLYSKVFDAIQPQDRSKALHMMQWLYLAARPLSLTELRFALASDSPNPFRRLHSELEKSRDYEDDDQMEKLVRSLSGGLAEVKSQGEEQIVQLIHESVHDFLAQDGLRMLSSRNESSIRQGHYQLSRICINYATLEDICDRVRAGEIHELPFLKYAVTYWGFHAEKAGSADGLQNDQPIGFGWRSDDMLQRWIEAYRLINDDEQATLLHYSSEHGLVNAVKLLLEQDVTVDSEDKEGQTPLSLAARHGHTEVVVLLLEKSARADSKNKRGQTPLIYAARNGHEEIVRLLLKKSVDVNSQGWQRRTPLWYAARNGRAGLVRILLEAHAEADLKDDAGQTPLSCAAEKGHEAVVELLLHTKSVDANLGNRDGRTPLWYAAGNGHEGVVKLLLQRDIVIDARDNDDQTPLSWAATNAQERVVKLLLEKKYDVDVDSRDIYGRTPLWYAADNGHEEVVKLLLEKDADANLADERGWTPLFWAAGNGYEGVVKLLLQKSVDVDAKDKDGRTPLSWAVSEGREKVVKLLLEAQGDFFDYTLLAYATDRMLKLLLEKHLNLDNDPGDKGGLIAPLKTTDVEKD